MMVICPTCSGKGTINDPKASAGNMGYSGTDGERHPQVPCRTCQGTGWVDKKELEQS